MKAEYIPERASKMLVRAVNAARAAVINLERLAADASYAAEQARRALTELELDCEDNVIAFGLSADPEPSQFQNSNPASQEDRDGSGH